MQLAPLHLGHVLMPGFVVRGVQLDSLKPMLKAPGTKKAVQFDPIQPTLKAPGPKRLKLSHDKLVSSYAFDCNLCRYIVDCHVHAPQYAFTGRGLHSSTFQLNVSAFCRTRSIQGGVRGYLWRG